MFRYTFTPAAVIENGQSYPASYAGHGSAIIAHFAGRQIVLRPGEAQYVEAAHAFAACIRGDVKPVEADPLHIEKPVQLLRTPHGRATADDEAFAKEALESLGVKPAAPELLAAGDGWRIVLDEALSRTRLIFDSTPTAAALALVEAARFFYSDATKSYHKKLTQKARRAALALADELNALAA